MNDRRLVELIIAETVDGKRGLFQIKPEYVSSGDLLRACGKIWEIVVRMTTFDDTEEYTCILKACDLYDVVGGNVDAIYRRIPRHEPDTTTETD